LRAILEKFIEPINEENVTISRVTCRKMKEKLKLGQGFLKKMLAARIKAGVV
jgi:hypothetical protein